PMPASIVSLAKAASSRFASAPVNRALVFGTLTHVHSLLVGHAPVYFWSGIVSLLDVWVFAAVVLRHSSAAFSVLEYIHPVSFMLALHRQVSIHRSLIRHPPGRLDSRANSCGYSCRSYRAGSVFRRIRYCSFQSHLPRL